MGTVDGIVSGMSTSSVIASLMQVEAAPQNALKAKVSTQQAMVSSYQSINTKMSALLTAAKALSDPIAWKGSTAKSTSDSVVATTSATGTSQNGSLTFSVKQLATAHSMVFDGRVAAATDSIMSGTSFNISVNGGAATTVTSTDTSLKGVVDTINKTSGLGVKASAVQVSPGQYTLMLTSSTTGKDAQFTIDGGIDQLGTANVATTGDNAILTVGTTSPTTTPFEVSSATNTFNGLMDGLTVTATSTTTSPVTVTVSSDGDGIATKIQAMIDAANSGLSEIDTQTRNKNGAVPGGPLAGNASMQQLSSDVLNTVAGGAGALGSFKAVGIELTRDGKLTFDKTAFMSALAADPVKTESYFHSATDADHNGVNDGLADKLTGVADAATQTNTGLLSQLIISGNSQVTGLTKNIDDWDVRLAARQETLQKQFTAMETALGKLKTQSSWITSQLG